MIAGRLARLLRRADRRAEHRVESIRIEEVKPPEAMVTCLAAHAGEAEAELERLGLSDEADSLEGVRKLRLMVLVAAEAMPGEQED